MTLINLTPHPIVFADGRTLSKCDKPPRLAELVEPAGEVDGIPVVRKTFDRDGCDLPPPANSLEDTRFIVSLLIAQAFAAVRSDLLVTDGPIRDEQGRIVGCQRLARV